MSVALERPRTGRRWRTRLRLAARIVLMPLYVLLASVSVVVIVLFTKGLLGF